MLDLAAAAGFIDRAGRCDSVRTGDQDLFQASQAVVFLFGCDCGRYSFTRKGSGDKIGKSFHFTDPFTGTAQPRYGDFNMFVRYGLTVDPDNGDVYVADAIDYQQQGIVYRYTADGDAVDEFYAGVTPGAFCWKR